MREISKANALGLVILTVLFTAYGQVIAKWRVRQAGFLPADFSQKLIFLTRLLLDPWVISGMMAAFLAGILWLSALTKLDLSYAYPFMSLAFVLVLILSAVLFHETLTVPKVLGVGLIMAGIIVASRG